MKEKIYRRLRLEDRKVIYNMSQEGFSQIEIAQAIGVSQGTISKELSRNKGKRGYRNIQAQRFSDARQSSKRSRPKVVTGSIKEQIDARLLFKHSPDQISKTLALEGISVSHEAIYRYILADKNEGGDLWRQLRINGKRRYRRRSKTGRGQKIAERVDIDERPAVVAMRKRYGDWEADLIQGASGSGHLLSIYERKSRLGKLYKLSCKNSLATAKGIVKILSRHKVKSITYDNGLEFSKHALVNKLLGCQSYFCKPYSSWEKGGVENFNGLVRQYFPKGMDFTKISTKRLKEVENELNNRPRNILSYRCPNDFLDCLKAS
ncbi:MAG: IS30 family transposase [Verrucomicrobia bacterium]|nr:IS30 family transposase [Verrucomicrobiota bacterium]